MNPNTVTALHAGVTNHARECNESARKWPRTLSQLAFGALAGSRGAWRVEVAALNVCGQAGFTARLSGLPFAASRRTFWGTWPGTLPSAVHPARRSP